MLCKLYELNKLNKLYELDELNYSPSVSSQGL